MTWREHWHLMARRDIADYEDPSQVLLTRWIIFGCPLFAVMLQKLCKSDVASRGVHDHPWSFVSLTLWGGYHEVRRLGRFGLDHIEPSRTLRFRQDTDLHRVLLDYEDKPAWTLVIHGPRTREWGFVDGDGHWTHWNKMRGDRPDYHDHPSTGRANKS